MKFEIVHQLSFLALLGFQPSICYNQGANSNKSFSLFFLQMFPMALVCGNTMVMKPSPRNPLAIMFIMKLAQEAGIPDGCVNVFHGTVERNVSVYLL